MNLHRQGHASEIDRFLFFYMLGLYSSIISRDVVTFEKLEGPLCQGFFQCGGGSNHLFSIVSLLDSESHCSVFGFFEKTLKEKLGRPEIFIYKRATRTFSYIIVTVNFQWFVSKKTKFIIYGLVCFGLVGPVF